MNPTNPVIQAYALAVMLVAGWCAHAAQPAIATTSTSPLTRAHSHNDYEQKRPLLDALDSGFCSVEADVHWVDGKLLVAHDADKVKPDKTLQSLYLDPLRERAKRYSGRIYPGEPKQFILLIDFKTEAESTYTALKQILQSYAPILTEFRSGRITERAITVVISGNRPKATMAKEDFRLAACDGRPADLSEASSSPALIPLVSESWNQLFTWRGTGPFPDADRAKLRSLVKQAHDQGRRIRFWALPDIEPAWQIAFDEKVDLINTDRIQELARFLAAR